MASLEKSLERWVVNECKKRGLMCIKLGELVGIPDRLIVGKGVVVFVEFKKPDTGRAGPLQERWRRQLKELGHQHEFIDNKADAVELLELVT